MLVRLVPFGRAALAGAGATPLRAARAAAATDGDASRKPNSGLTSLAGISGALIAGRAVTRPSFRLIEAIFMMSVNSSATAMRSDEVFGLKLITSAADALVLECLDGRGEVSVAGHDDGDVHPIGQAEQVHDQLDVEVRLHSAIAELADVLDDRLVAVLAKEVDELPLVLVLRVEPGICVGANQVAPLGGVLEEGDVIDVDILASSRVVHVGDVNKHRHVLAHG